MTDPGLPSAAAWNQRQVAFGNTPRAVLFRRFPNWLNDWLHRRHVRFVISCLAPDARNILDVGCGYGRIAAAVKAARPGATVEGVEFCDAFADQFERNIGPCLRVPVQQFRPSRRYDAVLAVTLLMYLSDVERPVVLDTLWSCLDGGRLICIEPAVEFMRLAGRRLERLAGPTSGLRRFARDELRDILTSLPNARLAADESIRVIPGLSAATLHHCMAVEKRSATPMG